MITESTRGTLLAGRGAAAAVRTSPRIARTLVVIATFNERHNLVRLLERIWDTSDVDVLIVDDSSPDGTGAIADMVAATDRRLGVLHRPAQEGMASARTLALRLALDMGYGFVVEMDADLSHPPEQIPALVAACGDRGVAVGSRFAAGARVVGKGRASTAMARLGARLSSAVLGLAIADSTGSYRCSSAAALRVLDLDNVRSTGRGINLELNWAWKRAGVTVTEVPVQFTQRTIGSSKASPGVLFGAVSLALRLRSRLVPCATRRTRALAPPDRMIAAAER